jgi:ATP-dependent Clp protease adaptor protein ClpS
MAETITKVKEITETVTLEPSKYKVVLLNDDKTPVEFVIAMLIKVFRHSEATAIAVTMQVHNDGAGIAGIYTYEVAEQKAIEGTNLARQHGYPLILKVEVE